MARRPAIYYVDLLHDHPEVGGVVAFSQLLFRELKRLTGDIVSVRQRLGARIAAMPLPQRSIFAKELVAADLIARQAPDGILFFPNFHCPAPLSGVAIRGQPRRVAVIHDLQFLALPENFSPKVRRWLDETCRATAKLADRIVFISNATRQHFEQVYGPPSSQAVIYDPILANPAAPPLSGPCYLLASYHLKAHPHKNFAKVLDVFAGLAAARDGLALWVTGYGQDELDGLLERLPAPLRPRVRHHGFVSRATLDGLYAGAAAFISLSRFEGFNMAAAEAASHGTPLILSDLPVHRELFEDCRVCFVGAEESPTERLLAFLHSSEGARRVTWKFSELCRPQAVAEAYLRAILP